MRKLLALALTLCLLMPMAMPQAMADGVSVAFHEGANNRTAMSVLDCPLSCRFGATAPFDRVVLSCPSWSDNVGTLTFRFYAWQGTHDATVAQAPLAEKTFVDYNDNSELGLEVDCEAGEYLIELIDGDGGVGVWAFTDTATGTWLYQNGVEMEGVFSMTIHYTETPEETFVPLEASEVLPEFENAPVVYAEDHPTIVRDAMPDTWKATDGLGRELPDAEEAGAPRENRTVGLFYWTWHCELSRSNAVNVTRVVEEYPEAINDYNHPVWKQLPAENYHWNEPVYGYYDTRDEWVLRRQAEMLAAAGVDVIIFDNTNGTLTWQSGYLKLLEVFAQAREDGVKTPQIAFMLPFLGGANTVTQLKSLYLDIYRRGRYQDLWFYWKGKPLIMAHGSSLDKNEPLEKEIFDFFTFRAGQPVYDFMKKAYTGQWGWLSNYPQTVYYIEGVAEQTTVGVAQNFNSTRGLTAMNGEGVYGRTYTSEGYDTRENAVLYGANFAQQAEYALEVDPEFVFITGWNEWVAGRYDGWGNVPNAFPDQFNDEFSRDIEPSKGKLQDHYYYQMVSFIRRYKGVREVPEASAPVTMALNAGDDAWSAVSPRYIAYEGNTFDRDADGYGDLHYTDTSGRNDMTECRVARNDEYIWFTLVCREEITQPAENWMRLLIDVEGNDGANWESFQYIVNRETPGQMAVLEKSAGGWNWEKVCDVQYCLQGNRLTVQIPRAALGIEGEFEVCFKWMDNTRPGDMMDVYVSGDSAPLGRYKYSYSAY